MPVELNPCSLCAHDTLLAENFVKLMRCSVPSEPLSLLHNHTEMDAISSGGECAMMEAEATRRWVESGVDCAWWGGWWRRR